MVVWWSPSTPPGNFKIVDFTKDPTGSEKQGVVR